MARLLADSGEKVDVIAQRWLGAPLEKSKLCGGNLIVHRVSLDEPTGSGSKSGVETTLLHGLASSDCPSQVFAWQAARVAEHLIETEGVDLIEAPEWEASLYYLQVRRALGLGPRRQPPCLVHLHSPSVLIFKHNRWDHSLTDFLPLCRMEEYTVRAADGLVCPSRYLGAQAERLFALPRDHISVIPYPLGDTPAIERTSDVWAHDSICYVGRLELRKGVLQWVEAAVEVARSHSRVTFDFIGSDTSLNGGMGGSVRHHLMERIPRMLQDRFRFCDSLTRDKLLERLARIPVVAVPSEWDNLPYTCIEAMATGVPVLASPNGGMAELIADGTSGWIASDATVSGLASALRRVLATPAGERAAMGREAARAVRRICSNEVVLKCHLDLRSRLVEAGARQSTEIPASIYVGSSSASTEGDLRVPPEADRRGMGIVVTCLSHPHLLPKCLESVERQTQPAQAIVVVVANCYRDTIQGRPWPGRLPGNIHLSDNG